MDGILLSRNLYTLRTFYKKYDYNKEMVDRDVGVTLSTINLPKWKDKVRQRMK